MVQIGKWKLEKIDIILVSIGVLALAGLVVFMNIAFSINDGTTGQAFSPQLQFILILASVLVFFTAVLLLLFRKRKTK